MNSCCGDWLRDRGAYAEPDLLHEQERAYFGHDKAARRRHAHEHAV